MYCLDVDNSRQCLKIVQGLIEYQSTETEAQESVRSTEKKKPRKTPSIGNQNPESLMKLAKDNGENQKNENSNDCNRDYPICGHPETQLVVCFT